LRAFPSTPSSPPPSNPLPCREEAAAKGAAARERMVNEYSPDVVAAQVVREFGRISAGIPEHPRPVQIELED